MGLFDKFRKKVHAAASEADATSLSAEEGSEEAIEAINQHQEIPISKNEEWEDLDESEELVLPTQKEDEWEEWDDDEDDYVLPTKLSRKEKKILAKQAKRESTQRKTLSTP